MNKELYSAVLMFLSETPKMTGEIYESVGEGYDRVDIYDTLVSLKVDRKVIRSVGYHGKTMGFAWALNI